MLWLIWLAALLPFAFATEIAADSVTIEKREAIANPEDLFDFAEDAEHQHAKRARHPVQHHKEHHKEHHKTRHQKHGDEAEHKHHSTEWHRRGYSNNWYIDRCLRHHNYHRRVHGAYDLQWDNSIAYVAQQIAQSCVYAHNQEADPEAGQNIAAGLPPSNVSGVITELWYNGERPYFRGQYGIPQPNFEYFEQWGHLTQVVWKGTTHFGCATQYCPQGLANTGGYVEPYFTVCNYKHAGNVAGQYAQNVGQPREAQTLHWYHY